MHANDALSATITQQRKDPTHDQATGPLLRIVDMSATLEATRPAKKKFGKGEREIPHHSQKAKKWYPVEDELKPRKVCGSLPIQSLSLAR